MNMTTPTAIPAYRASRKKTQDAVRAGVFHIAVIALGFVMIYPLLWMLASSFKGPDEIWTSVSSLIPQEFTFQNYIDGWRGFAGISFATFFKNSLIVTGISTVASFSRRRRWRMVLRASSFVGGDSGLR
jgi:multiple sugar transport system permease protein